MDIIIVMSNHSEEIHKLIVENGILENIIKLYSTNDILVKMNAVEIFSKIGESSWNADYISKHKIMN